MGNLFVCPRCGNSEERYIGYKNGEPYCRRCIRFVGEEAPRTEKHPHPVTLDLGYPLSKAQRALSDQILENFKNGIDTLIYAVCGSGKTEISYGVIGYAISRGLRVGFALPRRDVVIELYHRLQDAFPKEKIVAVYGGNSEELEGDCVILTTHQLFRYPAYFDLLVMDEIDAFPFKGDETLIALYRRSLKGHCVMMSATPSKELVSEFKKEGKQMLTLHTRFHRHEIPVPKNYVFPGPSKYGFLIWKVRKYLRKNLPVFIFVPTIESAKHVYKVLAAFFEGGDYVSSQRESRSLIIRRFKEGKLRYLVTTAVLERGVTVARLQVIVLSADNEIYDSASLIQIAGRVGRKADAPEGEVCFVCDRVTEEMESAIREIRFCNTFL